MVEFRHGALSSILYTYVPLYVSTSYKLGLYYEVLLMLPKARFGLPPCTLSILLGSDNRG